MYRKRRTIAIKQIAVEKKIVLLESFVSLIEMYTKKSIKVTTNTNRRIVLIIDLKIRMVLSRTEIG